MRILLVSQMYPGRADPDLGIFVAGLYAARDESPRQPRGPLGELAERDFGARPVARDRHECEAVRGCCIHYV